MRMGANAKEGSISFILWQSVLVKKYSSAARKWRLHMMTLGATFMYNELQVNIYSCINLKINQIYDKSTFLKQIL
jgi:hypothetical protein